MTPEEFSQLQYGMFVHFGLFSALARGEWVMNREQIPPREMEQYARSFNPEKFDAGALCRLAVEGGMRYLVFTTMHHEGFRMYKSALSAHNSYGACGRDFTAEIVAAARKYGLKIGKLKKADLNAMQRGTLAHFVFEKIINKYDYQRN